MLALRCNAFVPQRSIQIVSRSLITGRGFDLSKPRPFTLPPGLFRPKQSLGQNFLSDQNTIDKIIGTFADDSANGCKVVEIGPGTGALTRGLFEKYPAMTAIELDQRSVKFLNTKLPGLDVVHQNVLETNWPQLAISKGGSLNVIGNLPYYIVSQILFSMADCHFAINTAVLTMQLEVAERLVALPSTKDYGIPSVVFQLYGVPTMNFKIPPTVFYPKPKVDSALLTMDFTRPHAELELVNPSDLRRVVTTAFGQRRKMMRQSLKDLLAHRGMSLSDRWATKRPEELPPVDFIHLTLELYGPKTVNHRDVVLKSLDPARQFEADGPIWRVKQHLQ